MFNFTENEVQLIQASLKNFEMIIFDEEIILDDLKRIRTELERQNILLSRPDIGFISSALDNYLDLRIDEFEVYELQDVLNEIYHLP